MPRGISAIVPARNEEATIAACVEPLAQQPEIAEILVVDDQSTDRTAEIVRELIARYPHVRLLSTIELPKGWVGKNHAVWLGARAATQPWLLFTDADVVHEKNSAAKALEIAAQKPQPQLISFSPEQITATWYEKSLIPVVYCRLTKEFSFSDVNDLNNPAAAANGQFLMIIREAYDAVGGHAAIASEVLEDVALAKRVKAAGYPTWFGSGKGIVRVRMYSTFAAMWEGWKKNLYQLMGAKPGGIATEIVTAVAPLALLAILVAVLWAATGSWKLGLLATTVALVAWHVLYARELRRNQYSISLICYGIPGKLLYAAVFYASYQSHRVGRLAWKGREYPVSTPGASNK